MPTATRRIRRSRGDALADRAAQYGWGREQIVQRRDLGRSGAIRDGRLDFQRLVAEVGLGNVGLVLGIEMSRLARSCRDWHQLLEICALFDTLIADANGVYDPAHYNDRLLLGLKGTMSEAELHILKARMLAGRKAKAGRGQLGKPVPMGYVRRPSGEVAFDPPRVFEEFPPPYGLWACADCISLMYLRVAFPNRPVPFVIPNGTKICAACAV